LSGVARAPSGFGDDALHALLLYYYPGDVREVEKLVERAAALARGSLITLEDLPTLVIRALARAGGNMRDADRVPGRRPHRARGHRGRHLLALHSTRESGEGLSRGELAAPRALRRVVRPDRRDRARGTITTAVLSNLVSNVPAVLLLKPLISSFGEPDRGWLILAMASTLAGNLTILGSVANLILVEVARESRVRIGFLEYCRVGFR
jgi:hypothetical protein